MLQSLKDGSFNKACVDSGAGESACPVGVFPSYATYKTKKTGLKYRAAGGQRLTNVGERRPRFKTNGQLFGLTFHATTDVKKPLAASSRITAKGNRIVLDGAENDSNIENKATGARVPLKIQNGV